MRHGIFWPDRKLRLFDRRRKAQWGGTDPARPGRAASAKAMCSSSLQGELMHVSYRSFAEHRQHGPRLCCDCRQGDASPKDAAPGLLEPRRARGLRRFPQGLRCMKHGALDGWRGLLAAAMSARYDWIKYRDLRSLQRGAGRSQ
jgi:hypothetical protein